MTTELTTKIKESAISSEEATVLENTFTPFFKKAEGWAKKAKGIVVNDASQTEEIQHAREARLALKAIRVDTEKVRKKLKAESLRKGNAIDGLANIIKFLIVPIEQHLEEQEKFVERQREEEKQQEAARREALMLGYLDEEDAASYRLGEMTEEGFDKLLENTKEIYEQKKAAEKKAEEERVKREKEEEVERKKMKLENERLKKEAEETEREREKERRAQEDKERKTREQEQKKLDAERAEREKAEAQLRAKKEEEERMMQEAEERAEKEAADRKNKQYKDFLKKNGVTDDNITGYHIERKNSRFLLFKLIDSVEIS